VKENLAFRLLYLVDIRFGISLRTVKYPIVALSSEDKGILIQNTKSVLN